MDNNEEIAKNKSKLSALEKKTLNLNHDETKSKPASLSKISDGDLIESNSISSLTNSDDEQSFDNLKKNITKMETKCRALEIENENLRSNLELQERKNNKLQKKLEFVKENQEVFMKLKEAYITMKYNEAVGKEMREIQEKGTQTWSGILCAGCIEAEEVRTEARKYVDKYKNCCLISNETISDLGTTLNYLRDVVEKREKSWSINMERELKLREHVEALEKENNDLKTMIKARTDPRDDDNMKDKQEIEQLKHIILKYEKQFREINEKTSRRTRKLITPLSGIEDQVVKSLMLNSFNPKKGRSKSSTPYPKEKQSKEKISVKNLSQHSDLGKSRNPLFMLDTLFGSESLTDI